MSWIGTGRVKISCPAGYIRWGVRHEKDKELKNNLRKDWKLCYLVLHPGNNKQNVPLALIVIHETTITAAQSYFPNRRDVPDFLEIFNGW